MSRQFYTADETADIILSDILGRLDQISEIISDTESSLEEEDCLTSIAQMKIMKHQIHLFSHKDETHLTRPG